MGGYIQPVSLLSMTVFQGTGGTSITVAWGRINFCIITFDVLRVDKVTKSNKNLWSDY